MTLLRVLHFTGPNPSPPADTVWRSIATISLEGNECSDEVHEALLGKADVGDRLSVAESQADERPVGQIGLGNFDLVGRQPNRLHFHAPVVAPIATVAEGEGSASALPGGRTS